MIILGMQVEIYIPEVYSLKEKRSISKSIIKKAHNRFNVSISEINHLDVHQRLGLGIVCVGNEKRVLERSLDNILRFIEANYPVEILSVDWISR